MDELSRKDNIVQDEFFGKVVGGALGLMNAPGGLRQLLPQCERPAGAP